MAPGVNAAPGPPSGRLVAQPRPGGAEPVRGRSAVEKGGNTDIYPHLKKKKKKLVPKCWSIFAGSVPGARHFPALPSGTGSCSRGKEEKRLFAQISAPLWGGGVGPARGGGCGKALLPVRLPLGS